MGRKKGFEIKAGDRFGRLVVLSEVPPTKTSHQSRLACLCDCGIIKIYGRSNLAHGHSTSCGCRKAEVCGDVHRTHGHHPQGKQSRTYTAWCLMRSRCSDPSNKRFADYGGRGITVCPRWEKFENFLADMGEKPERLTLDRIDNERGYEPGNCRWATWEQQARNKRNSRFLTFGGETLTLAEWAERTGIQRGTIAARIDKFGWSVETALMRPVHR